jgi:hypothetical protein
MRTDPAELALLLIGGFGPMFLFVGALTSRKCVWAAWAKFAYLLASLAGLGWGIIGFIVLQSSAMTPRTFSLLLASKYVCAGMVIGFLLSIVIARPCQKRSTPHASADATQQI